ncbi:hypothetical protein V1512DRAFT_245119 [Lipomyces arxii]|uniref:uncharacterized protein n=1 Tax=Lipomyces arxii TaxID=56418 RepID=UPI0034CE481E
MSVNVVARVLYGTSELPSSCTLTLEPAVLAGYRRSGLTDEPYPAVIADPNGFVTGMLVRHVTPEQLQRFDEFEDTEYSRQVVSVKSVATGVAEDAHCYIWVDSLERLTGVDWDFDEFVKNGYSEWMDRQMKNCS